MELRSVAPSAKQDETYQAFYSSLEGYLSSASEQVHESKTMFSLGVYDGVFKFIEKAHKDPLGLISDKINNEIRGIHQILDGMVNAFFSAHAASLEKVNRVENRNNALYYFIVLKNDSISVRKPFLKFLFDYDTKPIASKFPIIFDFISDDVYKTLEAEYAPKPVSNGGIS